MTTLTAPRMPSTRATPVRSVTAAHSTLAPWLVITFLTVIFVAATVSPTSFPWMVSPARMLADRLDAKEHGLLLRRIALPFLGLVACIGLVQRGKAVLRPYGWRALMLGIVFVLATASLLWADDPALVRRKLAIRLLLWLGAVWAARQLDRGYLTRLVLYGSGATVLLGIVAEIAYGVFKPGVSDYRLMGLVHPNQTGEAAGFAALAAIALAAQSRTYRPRHLALAALAAGLLLMTRSRTALLATIVSMTVLLYVCLWHRRVLRWTAAWAAGGAIAGLCVWQVAGGKDLSEVIGGALAEGRQNSDLATLTERTPLWAELISRYVRAHPWLGYGFDGFWTTEHLIQISFLHHGLVYFHSHSGYIEMALSIGVPGAVAFTLAIVLTMTEAFRRYRRTADIDDAVGGVVMVYFLVAMLAEVPNFNIGITAFISTIALARYSLIQLDPAPSRSL